MDNVNYKKILIPFLTVFLLLAVDAFIIGRMNGYDFLYQVPSFKAKDLTGKTVDQDIFIGKFSIVCLWVTKDKDNSHKLLADIYNFINSTNSINSEEVQLVGIVGDMKELSETQFSDAFEVAKVCPDVLQIIPNDELYDILKRIKNAPTVFFIDKNGKITGQPVVGNEPILTRKEALRLLKADYDYGQLQNKAHRRIVNYSRL